MGDEDDLEQENTQHQSDVKELESGMQQRGTECVHTQTHFHHEVGQNGHTHQVQPMGHWTRVVNIQHLEPSRRHYHTIIRDRMNHHRNRLTVTL